MCSSIFQYKTGGYTLYYVTDKEISDTEAVSHIIITGFSGAGSRLDIPEKLEAGGVLFPVAEIGKKAFLGNGSLREITFPDTMMRIDDWAFAQCDNLNVAAVRTQTGHAITFGRGSFDDCCNLTDVCIDGRKSSLSALLAAIPCLLKAEYLMRAQDLGSGEWFDKWDSSLASFLSENDEEGYTDVVLCGEEDIQRSVPEYISDKRKRKSRLCLLRLMNRDGLSCDYEDRFTGYLLSHSKGCESEEAWEVILHVFGDDLEYYKLFADIGGITEHNIDGMIADMGECHAEEKAYLISYRQNNFAGADIFDSFTL